MVDIKITSQGIEKTLNKFNIYTSICEYVWNGFDANASEVILDISCDDVFGKINKIIIKDNGTGINYDILEEKFSPFLYSEKTELNSSLKSTYHGKNGIGRLTYLKFANNIKWDTIYTKNGDFYKYEINSSKSEVNKYSFTSLSKVDESKTGTIVTIENIFEKGYCKELISQLINEFAWFLLLNPSNNIIVNGKKLDIESLVDQKKIFKYDEFNGFEISVIVWKNKINEFSKIYYINSNDEELFKENTTFNKKGDKFYHSVYVKSSLFDNFNFVSKEQLDLFSKTKSCDEFVFIQKKIVSILKDIRVGYLKENAGQVIKKLKIEEAFKHYDKNNPLDIQKKECLSQMLESIYVAQPAVLNNLNSIQSKTIIRLLNLALDSGEVDSIFRILDEVIDLQPEERKELSKLLELTSLSNIIKTTSLIKERLQAIEDFKQLLYKKELGANEVTHIQKMMEKNYWLIGEQYHLFSKSEDNVYAALKNYSDLLQKEYDEIDEPEKKDKYKQFDILLSRYSIGYEIRENVLIELKHPDINLSDKHFSQVTNYMRIIRKQAMFNDSNTSWKFYLIGNSYNDFIKNLIESSKNYGERSLVQSIEDGKCKIYVKKWSEIFNDFSIRYKTILDVLSIQKNKLVKKYKDANEII